MKKTLMIIAIIAIIAITGSLIYYFVFFKPSQQKSEISLQEQKLELEKEKQRADEIKIEKDKEYKEQQELNNKAELAEKLGYLEKWRSEGLQKAYKNYKENWYNECINRGLAPDSPLPMDIANRLEDIYRKDINHINKLYQDLKDDIYKLYD